jgi:hypothetical protein
MPDVAAFENIDRGVTAVIVFGELLLVLVVVEGRATVSFDVIGWHAPPLRIPCGLA